MEEKEILELMRQDWDTGCEALIRQYRTLLWGICARRVGDPEDIRECVSSAIGDFCLQWERFQPEGHSLKTYLIAIADRKAMDKYRQNLRWHKARQAAARLAALMEKPSQAPWEDVKELLDLLPPLDREILRLRYLEDLPYREIGRRLNLNYEAVKKRGRRGLEKLRRLLAGLDE